MFNDMKTNGSTGFQNFGSTRDVILGWQKEQAWKAFQPERARQVLISPVCFLNNCYFKWDLFFKQLKSGIINGSIEIDLVTFNS